MTVFRGSPEIVNLQVSGDEAEIQVLLHEELIFFQGHFPQIPILPGVTQIHWAVLWGKQYLDVKGRFLGLSQVKFHMPVKPGDKLNVQLEWIREKSQLRFSYFLDGQVVSSGRVRFY